MDRQDEFGGRPVPGVRPVEAAKLDATIGALKKARRLMVVGKTREALTVLDDIIQAFENGRLPAAEQWRREETCQDGSSACPDPAAPVSGTTAGRTEQD